MSVSTEINRIKANIQNAYTSIGNKGGTLPTIQNSANLSSAIDSIQSGGGSSKYYTGSYDRTGLKSIGYTDAAVDWYNNFTYWFESEDDEHLLTQADKNLYGVVTENNISDYKGILVYLPSINTSNISNFYRFIYQCNLLQTIPQLNTSSGTDFRQMFQSCRLLRTIPLLDTSNGTRFSSMFSGCSSLSELPLFNTSNGTAFNTMFQSCNSLKTIPQFNTSNGTDFSWMFNGCYSLQTIPQLNTVNGTAFNIMFQSCYSLSMIPQINMTNAINISSMFSSCYSLKDIGGFLNLGQAYLTTQSANYTNYKLDLSSTSLLTHDSLMNIINNLYDIASKGCNAQQLVLGSNNMARLTAEEIAIATNKGWTVS